MEVHPAQSSSRGYGDLGFLGRDPDDTSSFAYLAGEVTSYSKGYPEDERSASAGPANGAGGDGQDANGDGPPTKKPKLTRIQQACENCGAKKQKCSGEQPCKPCANLGVECTYRVSKKRGPPKGSKRNKKNTSPDKDDFSPAPKNRKLGDSHNGGPGRAEEVSTNGNGEEAHPSNMSATSNDGYSHDLHDSGVGSSNFDLEDPLSRYRHESGPTHYRPPESSLYRPPPIKSAPTPWPPNARSESYRGDQERSRLASPPVSNAPGSIANNALLGGNGRESVGYPENMRGYGYSAGSSSGRLSDSRDLHPSPYSDFDRARDGHDGADSISPRYNEAATSYRQVDELRARSEAAGSRPDWQRPEEPTRSATHAVDAITQHYRGASSGIPALHARRADPEERRDSHPPTADRYRSGSGQPDSWPFTRSHVPSLPSGRSTKPEMDVMMPYGSGRDSAEDEQFILPPIRLPSTRVEGLSKGVHIPRALFDRLISYYFAISHHSCPIIYKPDVDIANIQNQLPPVLLDGMCCLAARFLEYDDLATFFPHLRGVGSERIRAAREQIEQYYYDRARRQIQDDDYRSDVTTVQALLLLTTRMVIDLGLHRKAALMCKTKEVTYGHIETRRRVFWQTYIMDKHAAASLGRPVFLREEDIDVLLPSEVAEDEFERWAGHYPFQRDGKPPPENRAISTHNAFARLSIILQSIINDVYSTRARKNHFEISPSTGEYLCYIVLRELYGQLQAWKAALPPHLRWTPGSDAAPPLPHQLLLHAFYYTCQLLVFRPVVPVSNQVSFPNQHQIPRPHDVCTQAADTIMQIMDVYQKSYGMHKVPSTTAVYYIFTAATIYVGNSSSSDNKVASEANTNLNKCIRLLDELSDACSAASQHRQILLDITSLSSTKLRSRDDAENLLSSRVPIQAKQNGKAAPTAVNANKSPRQPGSAASTTSKLPSTQAARKNAKTQADQAQQASAPQLQQSKSQQSPPRPVPPPLPEIQSALSQQQQQPQQQQQLAQQQQQQRHQPLQRDSAQSAVQPTQTGSAQQAQAYINGLAMPQQSASIQPQLSNAPSQTLPANFSATMARWADAARFGQHNQEQPHTAPHASLDMSQALQSQPFLGQGMTAQGQTSAGQSQALNTPVHRSPAEAFLPVDAASLEVNHVPSFTAQQYASNSRAQSPFDWSIFTNASTNLASANQADLAFWREMPIGFADTSDWDVFTDSYAHQLLTHIPSLNSYGTDANANGSG